MEGRVGRGEEKKGQTVGDGVRYDPISVTVVEGTVGRRYSSV